MTVRSLGLLCALCALGGESAVAAPRLSGVSPRGAQRGTEVVLTLTGADLGDAQQVIPYGPGLTFKKPEVLKPNQVKVAMTVAPDCRLGEHGFRLRAADGLSELRTVWVGALPCVNEVEPNNEFEKPQPIALNSTAHGSIGGEDQDFFVVECKKGQRLAVEVEGMRLGGTFWDPYVAILDSKRFELATSDDHPMLGQDGKCAVVCPADGKYIVLVRESSYGAGVQYRLHVGTFPSPTAVVPAGGRPGEELEVRFLGDPAGEIKQKVKLPAKPDDHFRLHCQTADGVSPTGFKFRVTDLPNTVGTEANVSHATAVAGPAPGAFNGVVDQPGQSKVFKFAAKKGQVYDVNCYARRIGSPLDPVLHVGKLNGGPMASNDDTGGPDSYVRFTAPDDGEYAVWVHDHLQKAGPSYFFRVEVAPPADESVVTIQRVDGNNPQNQSRQAVSVPRGNRFAALVNVTRKGFGGPMAVTFDRLPPGVTLAADQLDAGQSMLPVVFEAKADAPVGGNLGHFTAAVADPKRPPVPSRTAMGAVFAVGPGNTPYWTFETDQVAAAVAEAAPFKIDVVEPKAAVAQNSSMSLKVVATRAAGFTAPITLSPAWLPPGVGIQGSVTIPEGATEAVMAMNANGNAAARKWKTAILATAGTKTDQVWVSSQLFTVEVGPPVVTLAMNRATAEQGQPAQVYCKVAVGTPFAGEATVKLLGLPAKATTPDLKITKDTTELTFPVATEAAVPVGKHRVFCQVVVPMNGEQVAQSAGGAELRIDAPLPKAAPPAPKPAEAAKPAAPPPPAAAPPKRLSRLEQLRLEQEEREQAGKK